MSASKPKATARMVPGFSMQAYQKNTVTTRPRPVARDQRPADTAAASTFAAIFNRPTFPLATVYGTLSGRRFRWRVPVEMVDYETYMPILADGLHDRVQSYATCAALGLWDMLEKDVEDGERVLAALPRTLMALRHALDEGARDWTSVVRALKTLQKLTAVDRRGRVARAMVPYYRRLLPPVNAYLQDRRLFDVTASDGLDLNVTHNIVHLCDETLTVLERTGGPCAYVNIKYVVPTYESTMVACHVPKASGPENVDDDRDYVINIRI